MVPKNKRNESRLEFLDNAYNLQLEMIRTCSKFPKRYMFFFTQNLVKLATSCHENVKSANTIFPTNKEELQIRTNYLNNSLCDLYNLLSQLSIANKLTEISEHKLKTILEMIDKEIPLIKGLKNSDKKKFKFEKV
mgnify:CR=1 FL=1